MKILTLKDKRITHDQLDTLEHEFGQIMIQATEIVPHFRREQRDFSTYPTYIDNDGDVRPPDKWLRDTVQTVFSTYKQDIDHVFILIHEDNWLSDPPGKGGIWGTNYSNIYNGYQVHYCRYDRDNPANSLGTFYHEFMHSPDMLIKTYLDIKVEDKLGISDWDNCITHGKCSLPNTSYIRHKENTEWLKKIAPELKDAYAKRREMYFNVVKKPLMQQIITLSERVIVLLRALNNQKNGVPKS